MYKLFNLFSFVLLIGAFTSCVEVGPAERGVAYRPYGGGLDTSYVYPEGVDVGLSWLWNDMIRYNCRQQTLDIDVMLLDKNGMDVKVTASVFHRAMPNHIGQLHLAKGEDYELTYIKPVFEGKLKNTVGSYSGTELISDFRQQAEAELKQEMVEQLAANFLICDNVIIRDIDLPSSITTVIEQKQAQDQRNLVAEKKKAEEEYLAAAKVAKAKGEFEAAEYQARANQILSQPEMIELLDAQTRNEWAKKGVSPFGNNNFFGEGSVGIIKGLQESN